MIEPLANLTDAFVASKPGAWIIAYLVQSTVLLLGAWVLTHAVPGLSDRAREWLWRIALFGGVVTASISTLYPQLGMLPLPEYESVNADAPTLHASAHATEAHGTLDTIDETRAAESNTFAQKDRLQTSAVSTDATRDSTRNDEDASTAILEAAHLEYTLPYAFLTFSVIVTVVFVLRACVITRRMTRGRIPLTDSAFCDTLNELAAQFKLRRPVRLTTSERISVPIAFGFIRREVCLPSALVRDHKACELRPVLAHELAHFARHDLWWQSAARLVNASLFFQPLNAVALRELQRLAEFACDRLAVEKTGEVIRFAHSLTDVASRLLDRHQRPRDRDELLATGMATRRSTIAERVERVLEMASHTRRRHRRWRAADVITLACAASAVFLTPRLAPGDAGPPNAPTTTPTSTSIQFEQTTQTPEPHDVLRTPLTIDHPAETLVSIQRQLEALERQLEVIEQLADIIPDLDADTHAIISTMRARLDALATRRASLASHIRNEPNTQREDQQ